LRAVTTPHAHFLPESREKMEDTAKRNLFGEQVAICGPQAVRARRDPATEAAIEPQPDGVAAWLWRMPPYAVQRADAHGADRFYLVCEGTMTGPHGPLPRFAAAFVSAEEHAFDVVAGPGGLEVLVLQFPRR